MEYLVKDHCKCYSYIWQKAWCYYYPKNALLLYRFSSLNLSTYTRIALVKRLKILHIIGTCMSNISFCNIGNSKGYIKKHWVLWFRWQSYRSADAAEKKLNTLMQHYWKQSCFCFFSSSFWLLYFFYENEEQIYNLIKLNWYVLQRKQTGANSCCKSMRRKRNYSNISQKKILTYNLNIFLAKSF